MSWTRMPFVLLLIGILLINVPQGQPPEIVIVHMPELESAQKRSLDPSSLRLVTYNIQHGAGLDTQVDLTRVGSTLMATDADVIFLTEVDSHWRRSGFVDQPTELAMMLQTPYVAFAPALTRPGTNAMYGNALLSRFPIEEAERISLPSGPWQEPRVVLSAAIRLPNGMLLRIIGTHLGLNHSDRLAQAAILRELRSMYDTDLLVLMGDLNAHPDSPEIQLLLGAPDDGERSARWVDPMQGSRTPATFPTHAPRARIDYILVSENLKPMIRAYSSPFSDASDHLPVLAELSLTEGGAHQ
ncbi:MAG: endonuclease/exonuclease/phosphatase family protein [Limnochordia bacterium]|jgi:endonuclease/exonuclease/phosphatase family metal-dependent hydrolase